MLEEIPKTYRWGNPVETKFVNFMEEQRLTAMKKFDFCFLDKEHSEYEIFPYDEHDLAQYLLDMYISYEEEELNFDDTDS